MTITYLWQIWRHVNRFLTSDKTNRFLHVKKFFHHSQWCSWQMFDRPRHFHVLQKSHQIDTQTSPPANCKITTRISPSYPDATPAPSGRPLRTPMPAPSPDLSVESCEQEVRKCASVGVAVIFSDESASVGSVARRRVVLWWLTHGSRRKNSSSNTKNQMVSCAVRVDRLFVDQAGR